LAIYKRLLSFVKGTDRFREILTLARTEDLNDEDAVAKQITFLLGMNSYLGIQNVFKSIVGELSLRPELCRTLREEMASVLKPDPKNTDISKIVELPLLDRTLREILRLHPPVSLIFGRATRDRLIESRSGTCAIGRGELVMGVIPFAHRDPTVFAEPEEFRPDRFLDVAASQHLIWPRGLHDGELSPTNRTCPGKDVAIIIAKLFSIMLLSQFTWRLKDPQPKWERRFFGLNVAAPKGALEVESFHRRDLN
jgi:prostaglandin-endoperoxide synthase 2